MNELRNRKEKKKTQSKDRTFATSSRKGSRRKTTTARAHQIRKNDVNIKNKWTVPAVVSL